MRTLPLFPLLFVLFFPAVGCSSNRISWNGLTVEIRTEESESRLIFRDGTKTIFEQEGLRPLHKTGTLNAPGAVLFWATAFSGGESGCCENIHVFRQASAAIEVQTLEKSGYSDAFEVTDLAPADGFGEIVGVSEEFYGQTHSGCRITPGIHEGMSDLRVPVFFKPDLAGSLRLTDVTFMPAYADALRQRLDALSPAIAKLPAELPAPSADAAALLQVAAARKKAGLPAENLERFRILCDGQKLPIPPRGFRLAVP